ncbi:MAG TPA: GNAT family N-acetyltransferase [Phycisphaerae bacterium]|nr:GNAT family N-acetyltransferase [Phycisphaerae bacterium]
MIRIATPQHIAAIARLFQSVQDLHVTHVPGMFKQPSDDAVLAAWLARVFTDSSAYVLLAEESEKAVGYLYAKEVRKEENVIKPALHYFSLEHIAVLPAFQRRGVGTELMRALLAEMEIRKISRIELAVWSFNGKAQRFFARHGFAVFNQWMETFVTDV